MGKKKKKNHKSTANTLQTQSADLKVKELPKAEEAQKEEAQKEEALKEELQKEPEPKAEERKEAPVLSDTVPIPGDLTEILAAEEAPALEEKTETLTGSILDEAVNEARERLADQDGKAAAGDKETSYPEDTMHLFEPAPAFDPGQYPEGPPPQDMVLSQGEEEHSYLYPPEAEDHTYPLPQEVDALYSGGGELPAAEEEDLSAGPALSDHSAAVSAKKAELLSELSPVKEEPEAEGISDLELIELPEIEEDPLPEKESKASPKAAAKTKAPKPAKTKATKSKASKPAKPARPERAQQPVKIKQSRKGDSWFERNRHFCLTAVALMLVGVAVLIFVIGMSQKQKADEPKESVSVDVVLSGTESGESAVLVPTDPLTESQDEQLKSLISSYFKARQENDIDAYSALRSYTDSLEKAKLEAKSEYIEAYRNLKIYTKPGPYDDSLMVYVSYDLKLKEFDQTVPALETLVVCREKSVSGNESESSNGADAGKFYVYSGGFDENVVEYIKAITAQDDVVDLFKHVDTAYQEIMDANPEYEEYMASLKQLIRDGVGERLAAEAEDDPTPTPEEKDGEEEGEGEDGEEEGQDGEEADGKDDEEESFMVEATTSVNVRASDSENADRVGNVNPGTQLTCLKQLANGWSRVIFEGKEAYIKSEFLRVVQTAADVKVQGKVTVKDTVNIRADANTNSAILGSAYAGTTYDYVEKRDDGWTSILYNGKVAFIKSEYLK